MSSTRTWKLIALLAATTMVFSLVVTGTASGVSSDRATFTLVAVVETTGEPIERGFTFTDRLETTDGMPIDGWDGGRCINLHPGPDSLSQWMCDMVFHLPDGDITASGSFDLGGLIAGEADIVFAVTGGSGAFRNVRGEVEVVPIDDTRSYAVFRLIGGSVRY